MPYPPGSRQGDLLILDNFDHLVNQATWLANLLRQAPHVTILITSSEWLKIQDETVLILRGLRCPPEAVTDHLEHYPAVRFLLEEVHRFQPDFAPISAEDQAHDRRCAVSSVDYRWHCNWPHAGLLCSARRTCYRISSGLESLSIPLHQARRDQRQLAAVFFFRYSVSRYRNNRRTTVLPYFAIASLPKRLAQ